MGRKRDNGSSPERGKWRTPIVYAAYGAAVLTLVVAGLVVYNRVNQFLAEDPRFRLAEPSTDGGDRPALRIEGAAYTSRQKIIDTFAPDHGRSLYLLPLAERRRSLLAIDWVRDATVSRLWPDRLAVKIVERTPVAFVQLPQPENPASFGVALIDVEGVILEQPPHAKFSLPVVTGIRREQSQPMRRQRVTTALRLVKEIGPLASQVSEIDVAEPDNVKIVQPAQGKPVFLMLGNRNFLSRLQNFLNHYPEIQRRLPTAASFDLRLDDRITAMREEGRGG
jgi:cell division protein FtsQ